MLNQRLKRNYGVIETNPIGEGFHNEEAECINWNELKEMDNIKAERIRFVSDPGYPVWECSYFYVKIFNKRYSVLNHPFSTVDKRCFKTHLYNILKKENFYIQGFFDSISILL